MVDEVSTKFSSTQVAGILQMFLVIYSSLAPAMKWPMIDLGVEELTAIANLIVMVLPTIFMMWRRTKKSVLKWGIFK